MLASLGEANHAQEKCRDRVRDLGTYDNVPVLFGAPPFNRLRGTSSYV